jgi:N-glycosylase/DNA lyase
MDYFLKLPNIDLEATFNCGQCFRRPANISQAKNGVILHNVKKSDIPYWEIFFCADEDYSDLTARFSRDSTLKAACEFAPGIRVLRQEPFEALISFIISQNNNIKRISFIIAGLCEQAEPSPEFRPMGRFPTPEKLSSMDLTPFKMGYRARYVADAAKKVSSGEISLDEVAKMDYNSAKTELMKILGVGEKVADCVLLFGFHKLTAFPRDVWIKRVLAQYYPNGLPDCIKGYEGIAQQFLFHYVRNLKNAV